MADLLSDADVGIAPPSAPKNSASSSLLSDADVGIGQRVAYTPGQKQYASDEDLLAQNAGAVPDSAKAFGWSAGNTALLNAPHAATSLYESYAKDIPYSQASEEQSAYEEALSRQHPIASGIGMAAGLGAAAFTPLGPLADVAEAANVATAARLGSTAGKIAEGATIGGTLSGISGGLKTGDIHDAVKDAALGAGVGGVVAPIAGALGNYFTKIPAVIDSSGNLSKEAQNAVDVAFKDRMSDADIASFKDNLVSSFQAKGISPDVAREALLTKEGITPTRSLTTQQVAPESAADIGKNAAAEGQQAIAGKAEKLAGDAPASGEIAQALHEAEADAHEAASAGYKNIAPDADVFSPDAANLFVPEIQKSLAKNSHPINSDDLASSGNLYPQSAAAMKFIEDGIGAGNLPLRDPNTGVAPFNFSNVNAVRQALNGFERSASGKDQAAVIAIKNGFDNALGQAIAPTMFSGNGAVALANRMKADAGWADYKTTFFTQNGAGAPAFKSAMKQMLNKQANNMQVNLDQTSADTAQGILSTGLLDKKAGSDLYDRLNVALKNNPAGMTAVNNQIKNRVLQNPNDLPTFSKNIDTFLANHGQQNGIASKVFSPDELTQLRRMSESAKIINAQQIAKPQKDSLLSKLLGQAASLGVGAATYPFHGIPGAIAGYLGSQATGGLKSAISGALARRAEAAGAPTAYTRAPAPLRVFNKAPSGTSLVRNLPALQSSDVPGYQEPTTLPPLTIHRAQPIARATGGRVCDKLISDVERAKKLVNKRTEPLLNADDTHVAHALEIANQNFGN